jgi:hypothetical protein
MENPITDRADFHLKGHRSDMDPNAPDRQPREHAVTCRNCLRRQTWNHDGICDPCKEDS